MTKTKQPPPGKPPIPEVVQQQPDRIGEWNESRPIEHGVLPLQSARAGFRLSTLVPGATPSDEGAWALAAEFTPLDNHSALISRLRIMPGYLRADGLWVDLPPKLRFHRADPYPLQFRLMKGVARERNATTGLYDRAEFIVPALSLQNPAQRDGIFGMDGACADTLFLLDLPVSNNQTVQLQVRLGEQATPTAVPAGWWLSTAWDTLQRKQPRHELLAGQQEKIGQEPRLTPGALRDPLPIPFPLTILMHPATGDMALPTPAGELPVDPLPDVVWAALLSNESLSGHTSKATAVESTALQLLEDAHHYNGMDLWIDYTPQTDNAYWRLVVFGEDDLGAWREMGTISYGASANELYLNPYQPHDAGTASTMQSAQFALKGLRAHKVELKVWEIGASGGSGSGSGSGSGGAGVITIRASRYRTTDQ